MNGDDDRDRDERPRRSWREIDRMRDRPRERASGQGQPRGPAAEARARDATRQYLKQMQDELFAEHPAGREGEALARAVRDAHGTPGLADACRAYLEALGPPRDAGLISAFLDARDAEVVVTMLRALEDAVANHGFQAGTGLRGQLRMLADGLDDAAAEAAEAVLARL